MEIPVFGRFHNLVQWLRRSHTVADQWLQQWSPPLPRGQQRTYYFTRLFLRFSCDFDVFTFLNQADLIDKAWFDEFLVWELQRSERHPKYIHGLNLFPSWIQRRVLEWSSHYLSFTHPISLVLGGFPMEFIELMDTVSLRTKEITVQVYDRSDETEWECLSHLFQCCEQYSLCIEHRAEMVLSMTHVSDWIERAERLVVDQALLDAIRQYPCKMWNPSMVSTSVDVDQVSILTDSVHFLPIHDLEILHPDHRVLNNKLWSSLHTLRLKNVSWDLLLQTFRQAEFTNLHVFLSPNLEADLTLFLLQEEMRNQDIMLWGCWQWRSLEFEFATVSVEDQRLWLQWTSWLPWMNQFGLHSRRDQGVDVSFQWNVNQTTLTDYRFFAPQRAFHIKNSHNPADSKKRMHERIVCGLKIHLLELYTKDHLNGMNSPLACLPPYLFKSILTFL
jgi:hypothetical protein